MYCQIFFNASSVVCDDIITFLRRQVEEGKYYLEDHTGQVPLDFSQASLLTDGFVTENCIVLVEGEAVDGVLHVHHLGELICGFFLEERLIILADALISITTSMEILYNLRFRHVSGSPIVENRSSAIQAIGLQNTGE